MKVKSIEEVIDACARRVIDCWYMGRYPSTDPFNTTALSFIYGIDRKELDSRINARAEEIDALSRKK